MAVTGRKRVKDPSDKMRSYTVPTRLIKELGGYATAAEGMNTALLNAVDAAEAALAAGYTPKLPTTTGTMTIYIPESIVNSIREVGGRAAGEEVKFETALQLVALLAREKPQE